MSHYNKKLKKRWVAYFDILGFSSLVENASHPDLVLDVYYKALGLSEREIMSSRLSRVHFSDAFIFYSMDGTGKTYTWIQSVAKNFIRSCLREYIPLRGAIAFGEFHTEQKRGIYFGKALIEAYREAESQNWIGLILTKSAEEKVYEYGLKTSNHQFPIIAIPKKSQNKSKHPAYDFHRNGNVDQVLRALEYMKQSAPSKDKIKYQNTIDFINAGSQN